MLFYSMSPTTLGPRGRGKQPAPRTLSGMLGQLPGVIAQTPPIISLNTSSRAAIENYDATSSYTVPGAQPEPPRDYAVVIDPVWSETNPDPGVMPPVLPVPSQPTSFATEQPKVVVGISGLGIAAVGAGLVGLWLLFG